MLRHMSCVMYWSKNAVTIYKVTFVKNLICCISMYPTNTSIETWNDNGLSSESVGAKLTTYFFIYIYVSNLLYLGWLQDHTNSTVRNFKMIGFEFLANVFEKNWVVRKTRERFLSEKKSSFTERVWRKAVFTSLERWNNVTILFLFLVRYTWQPSMKHLIKRFIPNSAKLCWRFERRGLESQQEIQTPKLVCK